MTDDHGHSALTQQELERLRAEMKAALDRMQRSIERARPIFGYDRAHVAESTSDNTKGTPGTADGAADWGGAPGPPAN
jgi:hypothetical protein